MQSNQILLATLLFTSVYNTSIVYASTEMWPLRAKGEVRYLKFIKVYDASLYSPANISSETILKSNVSKCLKLKYALELSVDNFRQATDKILKRQHSPTFLAKIKQPLAQLQGAYQPVKSGDIYKLCYQAKSQTLILEHNQAKLIEIKSAELANTYLGIWLSDNKPISRPLYNRFFQGFTGVN